MANASKRLSVALIVLAVSLTALLAAPVKGLAALVDDLDPDTTVYISPYGKAFHLDKNCNGLSNATSVSETSYSRVGSRTLCKLCEERHGHGGPAAQWGEWRGSGGRWWYCHADGSYPRECWEHINGSWYRFDGDGWMMTGWLNEAGTWYYLDNSGEMLTGWRSVDGPWYYFAGSGAMRTGWLYSGNTWYYLGSSGAMATGWQRVGGSWYYLDDSGAMFANGWVGDYYLGPSGAMLTSCQTPDGYYVDGNGRWVA